MRCAGFSTQAIECAAKVLVNCDKVCEIRDVSVKLQVTSIKYQVSSIKLQATSCKRYILCNSVPEVPLWLQMWKIF
jgi:hypothetical protein